MIREREPDGLCCRQEHVSRPILLTVPISISKIRSHTHTQKHAYNVTSASPPWLTSGLTRLAYAILEFSFPTDTGGTRAKLGNILFNADQIIYSHETDLRAQIERSIQNMDRESSYFSSHLTHQTGLLKHAHFRLFSA